MKFLTNKYGLLLTVVLLVQGGFYYAVASRSELTPFIGPLASFPMQMGDWQMKEDHPIEPEVEAVLRADDTVNRVYVNPVSRQLATLFVAFFKTQRAGQSPHSPKNCLPGSGWEEVESGTISIDVPEWPQPIVANRYLVSHGDEKDLTIYWYQSHNRVIASEYSAKFWLVADAIRYRRSDTSLVRVMVPVVNDDTEAANKTGVAFVKAVFPGLLATLPN